jgi:hypothetical protein
VRLPSSRIALAAVAAVVAAAATAQPGSAPPLDWVPGALRPWIGWVLHDTPEAHCPRVDGSGDRACVFASSLSLSIDDTGADFKLDVTAYRADAALPLPGHAGAWPQDVRLDGKAVPVGATQSRPQIMLPAGRHRVDGRLSWRRVPAQLAIPPAFAEVSVLLRGRTVRPDDAGIVWLAQTSTQPAEADSVSIRVFRQVVDEVPAIVESAIELTVAGKPREIALPRALLPGFTALQLRGPLPIRLDGSSLRVQAVAGQYWVYVRSRQDAPLVELKLPAGSDTEIWSFAAVDEVRRVEVQGPVPVDPRQANVPADWQRLPAWRLKAGESLRVIERHRGDAAQAPSRLNLARTLWLDEDGAGLTFRDRLTGTFSGPQGDEGGAAGVQGPWRLDMQGPYELGRASLNGQDQYLTRVGPTAPTGVEVRGANVNLEADGRVNGHSEKLPIAGWTSDLQQASATLNVPPGWRLIHASGVEHAVGAWTSRWTLWDLFLALLICFAAAQVFGRWTAALLAAALTLSWTVPHSPGWWWLLPIVAAAAERAAGDAARIGRLATLVKRAGFAVVAVGIVAFSVGQIRGALHPVLEESDSFGDLSAGVSGAPTSEVASVAVAGAAPAAPSLQALSRARQRAKEEKKSASISSVEDNLSKVRQYEAVDPSAKVQTGPGVPTWQWRSYRLQWNGPVKARQQMRLWLAPPWLVRLGSVVTVLLLLAALWMMAGRPRPRIAASPPGAPEVPPKSAGQGTAATAAILACGVLSAVLLCASAPAWAQTAGPAPGAGAPNAAPLLPDGWLTLLRELRDRLLEPPPCAPSCASIPRLTVLARADLVELRVEVHAQVDAVVPLPGGVAWRSARNEIDGRTGEFTDGDNRQTAARVPAGVHTITRTLAAAGVNEIPIGLPSAPGAIDTKLDGWQMSGLRDDGTAGDSLNLVRAQRPSSAGRAFAAGGDAGVPPFAQVERTLSLGSRWQVETVIQRIDGGTRPQEVRIPLLPAEAVTAATIRVVDGVAFVSVSPGSTAHFSSELPIKSPIKLEAGKEPGQFDLWNLEASNMWTVTLGGTPPVFHVRGGLWSPQWRPWPGEAATLSIQRPDGVAGSTLTIDEAQLSVVPGVQATETHAAVAIRASLGGTHRLELPEGAKILALKKDGQDLPAYAEGRSVPILIEPGAHRVELAWREDRGIGSAFRVPQLGLGPTAVNAKVEVAVPADRWLLFAEGPTIGPVVLFWSMLIVLVAVAVAGARLVRSPLSMPAWIVLAVGAGQAGLAPALTVLAFVAAASLRERWGRSLEAWKFNFMQVAFALFAVVAVATLFAAVHNGLLGRPSMLVVGNGSNDTLLHWYQDRVAGTTPAATVISLPLWVWRVAMLAWSVWLALTVVRISGWVWQAFASGGRWQRMDFSIPKPRTPGPADS